MAQHQQPPQPIIPQQLQPQHNTQQLFQELPHHHHLQPVLLMKKRKKMKMLPTHTTLMEALRQ